MRLYTDDHRKLTREEEHKLGLAAKQGDLEARETLIQSCIPWALKLASKFCELNPNVYQDLIQESMIGLIDAVDKFDPERNTRLTTIAFYYVRRDCIRWLKDHRIIKVPYYEQYKNLKGDLPSKQPLCSLDVVEPNNEVFSYEEHEIVEQRDEMELVYDCMDALDERTRWIILERFKNQKRTLKDIGQELGITRERVRQIEKKGMDDLYYMMTGLTRSQKILI